MLAIAIELSLRSRSDQQLGGLLNIYIYGYQQFAPLEIC